MNRKAKIVILTILLVCLLTMFTACTYGPNDKLGIGDMSVGERILVGLQVALIGIGLVFIVLVILILLVTLLKYLMVLIDKVSKKKAEKLALKQQAQQEAQSSTDNTSIVADSNDEEVVAVIMAALTAYYDAQNVVYKSNLNFRVRSIKEIK